MKRLTRDEKRMIKSCFTYGMTWLQDNQYLSPIIERVGIDRVVKELEALEKTYSVVYCTYTDIEGCTYNSLVEKK